MKLSLKKLLTCSLAAVFAVCAGAFVALSAGGTLKAHAEEPTVNDLTLSRVGYINASYDHNDTAGIYGITRVTALIFTTGVFTGSTNSDTGVYDFSDLQAKTTYSGSGNTFGFIRANCFFVSGYKTDAVFNFFYLWTMNQPAEGDTVEMKAGAYFTMAGTMADGTFCNDKYVLSTDILLKYNGTCWESYTPFTVEGAFGGSGSGWDGLIYTAQKAGIAKWNIEWQDWSVDTFSVPVSGTCVLTSPNSNVFGSGPSDNLVSAINGIKYNGTELKSIPGAVVAEWFTNLFIYVPEARSGVISIDKGTVIGAHYALNDFYYVLNDVSNRVLWGVANTAANTTALSDNTTSPDADGLLWNGINSGGSVTIAGIEPGIPEIGTCSLINMESAVLGSNPSTNLVYASAGKTVLCNGAPLCEITGSAIATFANYLFIYVPSDDCIITIQKDTVIGASNYKIDKDYNYHFKKGINKSSLCYRVDFDSCGGSAVEGVWVNNGAAATKPADPVNGDKTFAYWYLENEDTPYDFASAVTSDVTLSAKWTEWTVKDVAFTGINTTWNNYAYDIQGYTRYSLLQFAGGISSGHHGQDMDMSDIIAKTVYTGSDNAWDIMASSLIYGPDHENNNTLIFRTGEPSVGDRLTVKAGAWFKVGGACTEKYVLSEDIDIVFNGTSWAEYVEITEIALTFQNMQFQNNAQNGASYWTSLCFLHTDDPAEYGVSTGNSTGTAADYSDLLAKTTYTGSENTVTYASAYVWGWAADTKNATFRFIYLKTASAPEAGDTVNIKAGAWFVTGGSINDKYTVSSDIELKFNGSVWATPFALTGVLWNGADMSGGAGAQLDAWGIENDHGAAAFPAAGTCALLNAGGALTATPTACDITAITGIKYNGTALKDVQGAVVAEWAGYLFIYVPFRSGVITVEEGAFVGTHYSAGTYYFTLTEHSSRAVWAEANKVTFNSNGGSAVDDAFVPSGTAVSAPATPQKGYYALEYWYLSDESVPYDFSAPVTEDITLTAKWSDIEYTPNAVHFDSNGGSAVASVTVNYGAAVLEPAAPSKDAPAGYEYTFAYWYLGDEFTPYDFSSVVTAEITLTAKWTEWTVAEVAFSSLGESNNPIGNPVAFYLTRINFTHNVSTGVEGEKDFSDLNANTVYTGSQPAYNWLSGNGVGYDANDTSKNFLYLQTLTAPEEGDKLAVKAGAWFKTGGTVYEKYVLSEDIELWFVNGVWAHPSEYEVTGITWNGADMSGGAGAQLDVWGIENNHGAAALPTAGTCALIGVGGAFTVAPTGNLAASITGIKYNGTAINEVQGAVVAEWAAHLFIYVPYRSGLITIEKGSFIGAHYAAETYYFILGEHAYGASWAQAIEPEFVNGDWVDFYGKQQTEFARVTETRTYNGFYNVILAFGFTDENRPSDPNAVLWLGDGANASSSSAIKGITVNGVNLSEYAGAYANYSLGYNYMLVVIPEEALLPTAEYPVTVLKINGGTVFENSILPEVTLTFAGGAFIEGEYEPYALSESGYNTISDIAGGEKIAVMSGGQFVSVTEGDDLDLRFVLSTDYLTDKNGTYSFLSLYLKATEDKSWDGFRVAFGIDATDISKLHYAAYVYDASAIVQEEIDNGGSGHKLLGCAPFGLAAKDFAAISVKITENAGKYTITIVEDGLKILEITDVTPRGDRIGNGLLIWSLAGDWTLSDYKAGDVSAPFISVRSREVYFLTEGDEAPEILYSVFDRTDLPADVTSEVIWDEDALTGGKVNAGVWSVIIRAADKNGNSAEKEITLYVEPSVRTFKVTFNGKNAAEYASGSRITEPEIPEKPSTERYRYVFEGWYNGEHKWDFVNDTVTENIDLVAVFTEKDVLYKVTFASSEGQVAVYAKYGAQIDFSFLEKEGYDMVMEIGGEPADMVMVTGETTVNVSYVMQKETAKKLAKGCFGGFAVEYALLAELLIAAAAIIIRKKENGNEE